MTRATLSACALLLFGTAVLSAQQPRIASPPLPVFQDNTLACYIRNTGTKALAVSVEVIVTDTTRLGPVLDSCNGGPLGPGQTCVQLFAIQTPKFVTCTATAESVSKLRGTLEIRETTPTLRVLVSEELR
jgi:hypothetical protein